MIDELKIMVESKPAVLAVDDEPFNLEMIQEYLSDLEIETVCVESGEEALHLLQQSPEKFSAVLLDRMMPGIDGIEVLKRIKADENINRLPIIMQTAKADKVSMLEGLAAGAHYYLSKPYDQQTLIAIVLSAIRDYQRYIDIQKSLNQSEQTLMLMNKGEFNFKSLKEARCLSALLAKACSESKNIAFILSELMINAVEHGNLGISYKEKSKLISDDAWENEVSHRLTLQENVNKHVNVVFERNDKEVTFIITDQGAGFDWQLYLEICPDRAFDSHGRGIAIANTLSSNKIEYMDAGNKVCVSVPNGLSL